jgi:hypothetical protein
MKAFQRCDQGRAWLFAGNNCKGQNNVRCFDSSYQFDWVSAKAEPVALVNTSVPLREEESDLLYLVHPSCRGGNNGY